MDAKIARLDANIVQDEQKNDLQQVDEFVEFEQTFANLLNGIDEGTTK